MNPSRIAEQRKKLGLSQEELAAKLKISQKSISKYECGNRRPSYETLLTMASIFGVSVEYLLGTQDEQEEPVYTNQIERNLLEIYRDYEDNGFSDAIVRKLTRFFPEINETLKLPLSESKMLNTFRYLTEDNQDIIIGKAKELLKEQRLESVAADKPMREAK